MIVIDFVFEAVQGRGYDAVVLTQGDFWPAENVFQNILR